MYFPQDLTETKTLEENWLFEKENELIFSQNRPKALEPEYY